MLACQWLRVLESVQMQARMQMQQQQMQALVPQQLPLPWPPNDRRDPLPPSRPKSSPLPAHVSP